MNENLNQLNMLPGSGLPDQEGTTLAQPRLASRRDMLRGVLLGGAGLALAGHARVARAGTVNLGSAPAVIGYLNAATVQANFNNMVANHPTLITKANLNYQEISILSGRYPGDLSAYFPAGSTAKSKYQYYREFFPCPPTLGCLGGLDSTLTEVYLDFRLFGGAPAGGIFAPLSLESATLATCLYYCGLVLSAYGAGYAAGSYLVGWMQKYDTTSWDQIVSLTGSVANAVSWFGSGIQNLASVAYSSNNFLFGRDSWSFNTQFFDLQPSTLGLGGGFGYDNSFGWGVFDDISSFDISGGCINPGDC